MRVKPRIFNRLCNDTKKVEPDPGRARCANPQDSLTEKNAHDPPLLCFSRTQSCPIDPYTYTNPKSSITASSALHSYPYSLDDGEGEHVGDEWQADVTGG